MNNLTRQSIRQAKKRIQRGKFPFPKFARYVRTRKATDHTFFLQTRPNWQYVTNLSGETQTLDLSGLYNLLAEVSR